MRDSFVGALVRKGKALGRALRRRGRRLSVALAARPSLSKAKLPWGELIVDPATDPGWRLLHADGFEERKLSAMRVLARPRDVLLDAGASFGYYTVALARQVERVVAVEPAPASYSLLRVNVLLNELDNVETRNVALGAGRSSAELKVTGDETFSSLAETGRDLVRDRVQVPVESLDRVYRDADRPPTVLKLDTEGAELAILEGGREVFRGESAPRLVFVEVDERNTLPHGYRPVELFRQMDAYGYSACDLEGTPVVESAHGSSAGPEEVIFFPSHSTPPRDKLVELREGERRVADGAAQS